MSEPLLPLRLPAKGSASGATFLGVPKHLSASNGQPVRRGNKISETIAQEIVRTICARGLSAGAQLPPEAQMIEEYQVGRASVREALRILEVQGLISIKAGPGGGPVVAEVSTADFAKMATLYFQVGGMTFRELMEARLIMEPTLAAMAATRRRDDPDVLNDLQVAAGATEIEDDLQYIRTSGDFHRLVAKMSGNNILYLFSHALEDILHERVRGYLFPPEERYQVVEDHRAVAQAIVNGQPTKARQLMLKHMERYKQFVEERHPALMDEVVDWH